VDALLLCGQAELQQNGSAYIVSDHCSLETFVSIIAAHLGKPTPRMRLPELPVRALAAACGWLPGVPLKTSRIDALTNRTVYCTDRIEAELGFSNLVSMEAGLAELVRVWKNGTT